MIDINSIFNEDGIDTFRTYFNMTTTANIIIAIFCIAALFALISKDIEEDI